MFSLPHVSHMKGSMTMLPKKSCQELEGLARLTNKSNQFVQPLYMR